MNDKIHKEKEDLYHLIHSLSNSELRQFRLFTKGLNPNKNRVNTLQAGVYVISLDLGGNTYATERFVKLSH